MQQSRGQVEDGHRINSAGNLRRLSQQVAKYAWKIKFQNGKLLESDRDELMTIQNLMEKYYTIVFYSSIDPNINEKEKLELESLTKVILPSYNTILESLRHMDGKNDFHLRYVQEIIKIEKDFLYNTNELVNLFEKTNKRKVEFLKVQEMIVTLLIALVLLAEAIFIIKPIMNKLAQKSKTLEEKNTELDAMNTELNDLSTTLKKRNMELVDLNKMLFKTTEQLKENESLLQDLNRKKDKFFSIIAHDLKNPFGNTYNLAHLIQKNQHTNLEKVEKFIPLLVESADQGMKLLENLLDWAKLQMGKIQIENQKLNLKILVRETLSSLSSIAAYKQIELRDAIDEGAEVIGDYQMVQTVMRNLITNSLKYTNPGGKITINSSTTENDNFRKICIKDNGIGMDQEELDKLFQIDSNFIRKGTSGEKGTGLGLILCKEFIELNQGRIWVESEKEKGSTFFITLPSSR